MNRWLRDIAAVVAVLALGAGLVACGDDDDGGGGGGATTTGGGEQVADVKFEGSLEEGVPRCYEEPQPKNLTIGYSNPLDANETVNTIGRTMKLETERLGGRFINLDAKADADLQVTQVNQLVAQKVDAMVVFPLDPKALNPALQRAQAAKIPVIGIEADLSKPEAQYYTSQVWQGRDYSAYLQAKEAARLMGKGAEFTQAGFAVPVPTIEAQVARSKYWAEKFGLKSLGRVDNPTDDIAGGEKAMTELLSQYPNMKGLVAYNEETATGAQAAARAQGKRDVILIGANGGSLGFDSVRTGKINATVQWDNVGVGTCAVWGAYDAAEGKKIPPAVLPPKRPVLINKDTVDQNKTWNDQLQEKYGKTK